MSYKPLSLGDVEEIIRTSEPENLVLPIPPRVDHSDHIVKTALMGHTKLAADHILYPEAKGKLLDIIGSAIRRLNLIFISANPAMLEGEERKKQVLSRFYAYDVLLEITWNLIGLESKRIGFSEEEVNRTLDAILNVLKDWEEIERKEYGSPVILKAVINEQLRSMKIVNKGNSMLAWMANEVEARLDENNLVESFIKAMKELFENNIYYQASLKKLCKFGNDYALGLRWLRHLGYVQVSTNPALAARAYDDDPTLWEKFKKYAKEVLAKKHPEWFNDPEKFSDELAMEATRFGLLENFYVFRPPFFWSDYHDGLVSYQLNPLIAHDADKSLKAAREFATRLEEDLKVYDEYLLWGYKTADIEKGRPNLVIKVAAAYPAALEIARRLNEMGIGQNITVSYTVAQEVLLGVSALEGMAKALKKGIKPVQTYDTNMGGRLEDHLRDTVAAQLVWKAIKDLSDEEKERKVNELLTKLLKDKQKLDKAMKMELKERIDYLVSKRVLGRNLLRKEFVDFLAESGAFGTREELVKMLEEIQYELALSGTFVAKRVYDILFSPWNREKWIKYLMNKYQLTREQAEYIFDRLDLLPASKRKPIDTLYTFASKNMTNTEFPNHQLKVQNEYMKPEFKLDDYAESILQPLDNEVLERLMKKYEDFVKAYEASPELNELLRKVGITENYGNRGIKTEDWPNYGPCKKTMKEFTNAYLQFREKVVATIKEIKKELES
ncbi:MAG: hypothetical protein DRO16_00465 [Thermoprotei archaeon]|nr:MAG: hypothetical protein DRO16_00465 [Thermoprotei archaeon]